MRQITLQTLAGFGITLLLIADNSAAQTATEPLDATSTKLFNGWSISPAGTIIPLEHLEAVLPDGNPNRSAANITADLPLKMIVSPDGKLLLAACAGYNSTGLAVVDLATNRLSQFIPLPEVWNGLAFSRDGKRVFVSGGDSAELHIFTYNSGKLTRERSVQPLPGDRPVFLAGIAVQPRTGVLYVANEANHEVWKLAADTLEAQGPIATGLHPHSCVFGGDGVHLYVSNWGSRSVSIIDTERSRKVRDVAVGVRPNDMALSPDGRLFVACSGDNTVHVIPTQTIEQPTLDPNPRRRPSESAREILATSLYPSSPEGSTPDAVAVAPDGKSLYVANADNNDVMAVDITRPGDSRIAGFIPVGWYPTALAVSRDSGTLLAANGKGIRSRAASPSSRRCQSRRRSRRNRPSPSKPSRNRPSRNRPNRNSRLRRRKPRRRQPQKERAIRSSGPHVGRLDRGDSAAGFGHTGPLHAAGDKELALQPRAHPPRGGQERLLHSRQDRR